MRLGQAARGLLVYTAAIHIHLHHVGPSLDYLGLFLASLASWMGLPGPGESVLIAASVVAAKHKLNIAPVLVTAWIGATVGGVLGWMVGAKLGRVVVTAPGPLRGLRLSAVARGDEVFRRVAAVAVLVAPSWISGIHHVRPALYLPVNALGAATWAAGIGISAYYLGPVVIDLVDDAGTAITILVVLAIGGGVAIEIVRRRRRRAAERG
jgi:membrane protein DedA with SNARE-associated domain